MMFGPLIPRNSSGDSVENEFNVDGLVKNINARYQEYLFREKLSGSSESSQSSTTTTSKSSEEATEFRTRGNKAFERTLDQKALHLYTKSVAFAVEESEEAALAYSNRSAVLFRLRKYLPCLLDINRALKCNYPQHLRKKLMNRKKECLAQINRSSGIRIKDDIATDPMNAKIKKQSNIDEWQSICNFGNPLLPKCSPKIKLEYNDCWGRHIVATKDIDAGEILSSQKFFLALLMPESWYTHCSYCLLKCYALIPCLTCSKMMYCSNQCRVRADQAYHRIECKLSEMSKNFMYKEIRVQSTRALLIGTEQGAKLKNLMERLSLRDIFKDITNPANKLFMTDYLSLLSIRTAFDYPLMVYFLIAVELIVELRRVGFFGEFSAKSGKVEQDHLSEAEIFTSMLWLNHMVSLNKLTFEVFEYEDHMPNLHSSHSLQQTTVGFCIEILHSIINHSCDPNVWHMTRNREHVLFAARPIKKGEQIFTTYVDKYYMKSKTARTSQLSSIYEIDCKCEACVNNWPLAPELVERRPEFLVLSKEDVLKYLTQELRLFFHKDDVSKLSNREILRIASRHSKWLHANVKKPSFLFLDSGDFFLFFMTLSYNESSQEFMSKYRNDGRVENYFLRLLEYL